MGLIYALAACLVWGLVVPIHFRLLDAVPPAAILAHRIVWSALLVAVLLSVTGLRRRLVPKPRRRHALLAVSAGLIAVNWLFYVTAVNTGRMLEASLGYYVSPLVNVALGALVLGERLRPVQVAAVTVAAAGVGLAVAMAGSLPLLALGIAVSFSLYGLVRKIVGVSGMVGFGVETLLLLPLAFLYLGPGGTPAGTSPDALTVVLLMLTGATTALPLIWFAAAAQRLTLTSLGLLQYVAPSLLLMLSVLVYGEPLTADRMVTFGLIWVALALYAGDALRAARGASPASAGGERPAVRT